MPASKRRYEVCVIGAGVIGLACAWRALQRGLSVICIDRAHPGAGASGVAAGMLAPVTEADFGEKDLLDLNLAGIRLWPQFAAELEQSSGCDTGYRQSGALVVACDRDDAFELRRLHEFQRSLGLEVSWLTARECRELEPALSPRVAGGVFSDCDHQADPRATVRALDEAFRRAGGEVLTCTEVVSVDSDGERCVGVSTSDGTSIAADQIVICAGCFTPQLAGIDSTVCSLLRPVKGQILRFAQGSQPALCTRLVRTPRCYVVNRADGEVVLGATTEERGFDTGVTADGLFRLLEAAREVLPDLAELEFVQARAGLRPGTPDNAPLIGTDSELDGLVWAVGHHRNGVLLAPLTAEAVADLLTGAQPPQVASQFGPGRFEVQSTPGFAR